MSLSQFIFVRIYSIEINIFKSFVIVFRERSGIVFVPAKSCAFYKSPNENNSKELQGTECHTPCHNRFSPLDTESLDQSFENPEGIVH